MALDTSALRMEWLCISVGIASQQRDRNQSVCSMLVLTVSMVGSSLWGWTVWCTDSERVTKRGGLDGGIVSDASCASVQRI
jgi:hypothetical protein